jgi:hypothetical protein
VLTLSVGSKAPGSEHHTLGHVRRCPSLQAAVAAMASSDVRPSQGLAAPATWEDDASGQWTRSSGVDEAPLHVLRAKTETTNQGQDSTSGRSGGAKTEVETSVRPAQKYTYKPWKYYTYEFCDVCHVKWRNQASPRLFCFRCARGPLCVRCRNNDRPRHVGQTSARGTPKVRAAMCHSCVCGEMGRNIQWWFKKGAGGSLVR